MKLYMSEDEKYPHVFIKTEDEVRRDVEEAAVRYKERFGTAATVDLRGPLKHLRDVPDDLGAELVALRKRETELLDAIEKHVRTTGQPMVQEDWTP